MKLFSYRRHQKWLFGGITNEATFDIDPCVRELKILTITCSALDALSSHVNYIHCV